MSDQGGDPPCWAHLFDEDADTAIPEGAVLADLGAATGSGGAVWSLPHGGDLDANLVRLDPDASIGEHVNDEVDVLLVVQSGSGQVVIGNTIGLLRENNLALIPRGSARRIIAGPEGLTYLSVHRRRGPFGIKTRTEPRE